MLFEKTTEMKSCNFSSKSLKVLLCITFLIITWDLDPNNLTSSMILQSFHPRPDDEMHL